MTRPWRGLCLATIVAVWGIASTVSCGAVVVDARGDAGEGGEAAAGGGGGGPGNGGGSVTSVTVGTGGTGSSGVGGALPQGRPVEEIVFDVCPAAKGYRPACLTIADEALFVVDLTTGNACHVSDFPAIKPTPGLAVIGSYVWMCNDTNGVAVMNVEEGFHTGRGTTVCSSLAAYNGGLVLRRTSYQLVFYEDAEDIGTPTLPTILPFETSDRRIAIRDGRLFVTSSSGSTLTTHELPSGAVESEVELEGYDTWFNGIAPRPDGTIVVMDEDSQMHTFAADGSLISTVTNSLNRPLGLSCLD